jgi:5'-deoxynucleotidase YfbR-like HD superfamily hydrolase
MNTPENTDGTLLKSTALFAFLDEQRSKQRSKADTKHREQRDAQLMAEMHDECRYVIEDIIDRVKKLEAEYREANAQAMASADEKTTPKEKTL